MIFSAVSNILLNLIIEVFFIYSIVSLFLDLYFYVKSVVFDFLFYEYFQDFFFSAPYPRVTVPDIFECESFGVPVGPLQGGGDGVFLQRALAFALAALTYTVWRFFSEVMGIHIASVRLA